MGGRKFLSLSNTQQFDLREINEMLIAGPNQLKTSYQFWGRYLTLKSNQGNVFLFVPNIVLKDMIKVIPGEKIKFLHYYEVKRGT